MEHALGEEARAGAVVDDAALHVGHEIEQIIVVEVIQSQIAGFVQTGVHLGDNRDDAAVAEVGVGVAQLEVAPLGVAVGLPALFGGGEFGDVGPADRRVRPSQGFGHRLPHGDHHRAEHEVIGRAHDQVFAVGLAPLGVGHRDINRRGRAPHGWLQIALDDPVSGFDRAHRRCLDDDLRAGLGLVARLVVAFHQGDQPFFFFRAVDDADDDFSSAQVGDRALARRSAGQADD